MTPPSQYAAIIATLHAAVVPQRGIPALARATGIKRAALSHYLTGRRRMPIEVMEAIAGALGMALVVKLVKTKAARPPK